MVNPRLAVRFHEFSVNSVSNCQFQCQIVKLVSIPAISNVRNSLVAIIPVPEWGFHVNADQTVHSSHVPNR